MLHNARNGLRFRELAEDMDMVRNAANYEGRALFVFQDRGQIGVCSLPKIFVDKQRLSILGRKD